MSTFATNLVVVKYSKVMLLEISKISFILELSILEKYFIINIFREINFIP